MKPRFLVYTDHPMCSIECTDGIVEVLNQSGRYEAVMVGPNSFPKLDLTPDNLKNADCLVMPGGLGDSDQFDLDLINYSDVIKDYVASGGRYLGICMGAYFAGYHYLNMLKDAKAVQYIKRKDSTIKRLDHDVVNLLWKGKEVTMYFHDGAAFVPLHGKTINADIIAKYQNGDVAAMIQKYKKGKVGVIGTHPEAQKWWYYSQTRIRDRWKDCIHHDLVLDFVKKLLV